MKSTRLTHLLTLQVYSLSPDKRLLWISPDCVKMIRYNAIPLKSDSTYTYIQILARFPECLVSCWPTTGGRWSASRTLRQSAADTLSFFRSQLFFPHNQNCQQSGRDNANTRAVDESTYIGNRQTPAGEDSSLTVMIPLLTCRTSLTLTSSHSARSSG